MLSFTSCLVNDVAIAMAYSTVNKFGQTHPLEAAAAVFQGYSAKRTLTAEEMQALPILVACRLAISTTLGNFSIAKDPDNEYLHLHAQPGWNALAIIQTERAALVQRLTLATK